MQFLPIEPENRDKVNYFIKNHWLSTDILIRGKIVDATKLDGFFLEDKDGNITALVTYDIRPTECEIVTLNSLGGGAGIPTIIIERVAGIARAHGCSRLIVMATNNNIRAITFYQQAGFEMANFYRDSIKDNHYLKPLIPEASWQNGIPIHHELEFEMRL